MSEVLERAPEDVAKPGEIDLELEPAPAPEPDAKVETPEPEPEPEPEPKADDAKPVKKGLVAELVEQRNETKKEREARVAAETELARLRGDINAGRLITAPPPESHAGLPKSKVEAIAKKLGFKNEDGSLNLDAAATVASVIQSEAREIVAPLQNATLEQRANANMAQLWANAKEQGIDDATLEVIGHEFRTVMSQPNAAAMIADAGVAQTIFQKGLGSAFLAGKLSTGKPVKKAESTPPTPPEGGGRRPTASAITLSPALQKVYKDAGLDPSKAKSPVADDRGAYSLED